MEQGRDKWTDPRIDDLRDGVKDLGGRVDAGFAQVDARFARVDERFDALQRTLMLTGAGIIAALIALIGTQL